MEETTRREFLVQAAAGAALAALAEDVLAQQSPGSATGMPTRVLGRTGERVAILCLPSIRLWKNYPRGALIQRSR